MNARIIIIIVLIAAVLGGLALAVHSLHAHRYAWLFKGAYAEYEGSTLMMGLIPANITMQIEVLEYNRTHAHLLFHLKLNALGDNEDESYDRWMRLDRPWSLENVTSVYNKTVHLEKLGTRECRVLERSVDGVKMIMYIDKQVEWPVRIELAGTVEGEEIKIVLELKETNIPFT